MRGFSVILREWNRRESAHHNPTGEQGSGYVIEIHDGTVAGLAPGKILENMTGAMLREAATFLEALEKDNVLRYI